MLAHQPGMVGRDERWWTYLQADLPAMRPARTSPIRCLLAEDDSGPRGYAVYRTRSNWDSNHVADGVLEIVELYATDPAAAAALWTDLLTRDLVGEVRARRRPLDEPLLAMLADPRRARPVLGEGLWLRIVDLPAGYVAAPVRDRRGPGARGHRSAARRQCWPLAAAGRRARRRRCYLRAHERRGRRPAHRPGTRLPPTWAAVSSASSLRPVRPPS